MAGQLVRHPTPIFPIPIIIRSLAHSDTPLGRRAKLRMRTTMANFFHLPRPNYTVHKRQSPNILVNRLDNKPFLPTTSQQKNAEATRAFKKIFRKRVISETGSNRRSLPCQRNLDRFENNHFNEPRIETVTE